VISPKKIAETELIRGKEVLIKDPVVRIFNTCRKVKEKKAAK